MARQLPCLILGFLSLTAGAAELASISVTPQSVVLVTGSTRLFTATGTFTDATTGRLGNATLAAGGNHTCAIIENGTVRCWGQDGAGQLGDGAPTNVNVRVPVTVTGISNATGLAGGFEHSCAVLADGVVKCWGRGSEGQLGNGGFVASTGPVTVSNLVGTTAIAVGAGYQHSCALLSSGGVRCWGANGNGQLGNGTTVATNSPVTVSGISSAVGLAVGGNNACAVLASGALRCWGANNAGQLGNGGGGDSSTPVNVTGITQAVSVAAGFDYNCVLIAGGNVQCWGSGSNGQLGNGGLANSPIPVNTSLFEDFVALSASSGHTCALTATGLSVCWGGNGNGQLGNGSLVGTFPSPGYVSDINGAIAITTGSQHSCALLSNGALRCWGLNQEGQIGNGSLVARSGLPLAVTGTAMAVDAGGHHSCAIGTYGRISCWGVNAWGQLGQGSGSNTKPVVVVGIDNATDITLGFDHTCAVLAGGAGWCWGRNDLGQLGINSTSPSQTSTPTSPFNLAPVLAMAAGAYHNCAVLQSGGVQCWGQNNAGQVAYDLGTGVIVPFPSTVLGISTATAITAGFEHTCALLASGSVLCWGRGDEGQLGNGGTANTNSPVTVTGITTATAISAGNFHTCARLASSEIRCWGRGDEGQLGNNAFADSSTPVDTQNDLNAAEITSGGFHSCLRSQFGSVRCWGRGDQGQIGNGGLVNVGSPVQASIVSNVTALDAGRSHTCGLLQNGTLQCWGYDEFGQLGDGGTANSPLPVVARGLDLEAVALAWSPGEPFMSTAMSGHVKVESNGNSILSARYGPVGSGALVAAGPDTDGDGVADPADNCTLVPNAGQLDTNSDGYGNICDADLNNSDLVTAADYAILRSVLNQNASASPTAADADLNGSGLVTAADYAILRARINTAPGPSALHP